MTIFAIVTILTLCCTSSAFAKENIQESAKLDQKILFQSSDVSNIDILQQKAENGISDLSKEAITSTPKLYSKDLNVVIEMESKSTTQLLEKITQNNITTDGYVTTVFAIMPNAIGSEYDDKWDSTSGIMAYSRDNYHWNGWDII